MPVNIIPPNHIFFTTFGGSDRIALIPYLIGCIFKARGARIAMENRGKSGGARVCFVDFVIAETVYLITVYPKNEKDNLSKEERNEIKKVIEALKKSLGGE